VLEGKLITPALRKYPMENTMSIPKGYVTDNWSVLMCLRAVYSRLTQLRSQFNADQFSELDGLN